MAPGYRANNQSRRANRTYVDHDVFEGLPVRNWRRETITVTPPPTHEISAQKDKWDIELPWGMPKDSHLLPQHSQDLLRAARSGKLYVRRPPVEEEELDAEAAVGDKPEKKEEDSKEKGFVVKSWKPVPRHLEGPEIEYLAKRRKGLTGSAIKTAAVVGATMTKTRVRRTDAAGNTYVEDVVVAEGQAVEGEVISQTAITNSALSGVVADSLPVQPTPPRRRPPPPKRKAKGPGRGRKRKAPLPPTSVPGEPGATKTEGQMQEAGVQEAAIGPDGIKLETSTPANNDNEGTEMGDDSVLPSDEEGDDGSDEEDHDEGEGQGEQDDEEMDHSRSDLPDLPHTETIGSVDRAESNGNGRERGRDASSSPDLPLATMASAPGHEHGPAGSPLKNVITFPPPAFGDQSPDLHSDEEMEAEEDLDEGVHDNIHDNIHEKMESSMENDEAHSAYHLTHEVEMGMQAENTIPYNLGLGNEKGHVDGDGTLMQQSKEYVDEDDMLLDGDVDSMDFSAIPTEPYPQDFHPHMDEVRAVSALDDMPLLEPGEDQDHDQIPEQEILLLPPPAEHEEMPVEPQPAAPEGEDTFEDLLGSLEDHLNDQGPDPGSDAMVDQGEEEEEEEEVVPVPVPVSAADFAANFAVDFAAVEDAARAEAEAEAEVEAEAEAEAEAAVVKAGELGVVVMAEEGDGGNAGLPEEV